jgi:hypothetical protein
MNNEPSIHRRRLAGVLRWCGLLAVSALMWAWALADMTLRVTFAWLFTAIIVLAVGIVLDPQHDHRSQRHEDDR